MFKKIAIFPIRVYQVAIRPFFPSSCVFHAHGKKGCSEYAVSMIREKGVVKGFLLGGFRIIRCHPFQKVFDDPEW